MAIKEYIILQLANKFLCSLGNLPRVVFLPLWQLHQCVEFSTIPVGIPSITTYSSSSVRMVSAGLQEPDDVVILDRGSDVSLLPLGYGHCGETSIPHEDVQLRDCQGEHLSVAGYRTVVQDGDGTEAELEHSFLIANVRSCILSLGQLYRSGWSVKQMEDGGGPFLESPDQELRVPVFYQRNSLAIKATVCRVEQVAEGDMPSPHAFVRAVVELEDRFRPSTPRNNQWQVSQGNPFMHCVGTHFVDPRPTWAGNWFSNNPYSKAFPSRRRSWLACCGK